MKPASYRLSLLAGCAVFILGASTGSFASADSTASNAPSIEVHLDVLSHLSDPKPTMPAAGTGAAPAAAPAAASSDVSPFGEPSKPLANEKKADEKKVADKKAPEKKTASAAKPKEQHTHTAKAESHPQKHPVKVASKPKPKEEPKEAAKEAPKETPKETVVADATPPADLPPPPLKNPAPLPEVKNSKPDADAAIPKPDVKALKDEPATPAAPALATPPDVPQLADTDVKPPKPVSKPNLIADAQGGVADLLGGDDTGNTAAAAKPAAEPAKPVVAAAPAATSLSAPPPDLVTAAPAKENPPAPPELPVAAADTHSDKDNGKTASAPADLPPPVPLAADAHNDKDSGKMVVASNDLPPSPAAPPPAMTPDLPKPDLPAPAVGADAGAPPLQMAQSTMVPLAIPPAKPEEPAATPPAPAPGASAPTPAAASTPAAPLPATAADSSGDAPAGATPDLRLAFNESETDVPLGSTGKLDALAAQLNGNPALRVTIMAYASGPETTGIYPKRVSLARGIAVRNYLTSTKGVDIERVNVKALGNKDSGGGPGDRVDLFILK